MTPRLEVFGSLRRWYVRLRYGNGRKAMVSESYTRRTDAYRAADDIQDALGIDLAVIEGKEVNRVARKKKGYRPKPKMPC